MPTLTEKIDSREWTTGERPSVTMHYVLDGTSDDLTAKALLPSSTPAEPDGLACVAGVCPAKVMRKILVIGRPSR